jgi:hypothetical protein
VRWDWRTQRTRIWATRSGIYRTSIRDVKLSKCRLADGLGVYLVREEDVNEIDTNRGGRSDRVGIGS